jgi:heme exporter protein C
MEILFQKRWWKYGAALLVLYVIIAGLLMPAPRLDILNETIRNLYFHVAAWFAMFILLIASLVYSIKFLRDGRPLYDMYAVEFANMAIVYGLIGVATGSIWAKYTWGAWWTNDPKLNTTTIALLIYMAYVVLRASIEEAQQKGRISAVYNIFAFAAAVPLIFILPRMTDSLHPGNGGNPGFNSYDLDNDLRKVFYPAVLAWTLIGFWISSLRIRKRKLEAELVEWEDSKRQ